MSNESFALAVVGYTEALGLLEAGVPAELLRAVTDGIGTPDPNPKHLVNWCFSYTLGNLTFVLSCLSGALVGVGGFRFHWLRPISLLTLPLLTLLDSKFPGNPLWT